MNGVWHRGVPPESTCGRGGATPALSGPLRRAVFALGAAFVAAS